MKKDISYPKFDSTTPAKTRFGGVPIIVAMPPIEALYAIESNKAFPNCLFSLTEVEGLSSSCFIIASAIGSIITDVAVFDIHIDKNAVATIKPKIIRLILVPIAEMIFKAILL